ncbi:ferredoxin family protein, partial [uncultured Cobetia sp.]
MLSSSLESAQRALNQQARQRALSSAMGGSPASSLPLLATDAGSAPIRYHSQGRTVIIGSEARVRALASLLSRLPATAQLPLALLISEQDNSALVTMDEQHLAASESLPVHSAPRDMLALSGHLGQFSLASDGVNLAAALVPQGAGSATHFDLIADLSSQPLNQAELPPPGYLQAGADVIAELDQLVADAEASQESLSQLTAWAMQFAGLIGNFDKPNYVTVNLDTCAHSSAGNIGCTRCLSSCSADAIFSVAGRRNAHIEIDPYLCHGAASCVSACPTGALSFTQPPAEQRMEQIQRLLERYQDGGGLYPLLRYRLEQSPASQTALASVDQERCLDITLEEISATGHDEWLAALALGATQVIVELPHDLPAGQHQQLDSERRLALTLLDSMGLANADSGEPRIRFVSLPSPLPQMDSYETEALPLITPLCVALAPGADSEEEQQPSQP